MVVLVLVVVLVVGLVRNLVWAEALKACCNCSGVTSWPFRYNLLSNWECLSDVSNFVSVCVLVPLEKARLKGTEGGEGVVVVVV